jgi:hypothetical protein
MKYRVKVDDPSGRWKVGEIGAGLPNDYPRKYAYKLDLGRIVHSPGATLFGRPIFQTARIYYFHEGEVEPVGEC